MTITSFAPTSLCAILPSGETLLFVNPGMSSVVGLTRGVELPEFDFIVGPMVRVANPSDTDCRWPLRCGLLGAVGAGVSFFAIVAPMTSGRPFVAALDGCKCDGGSLKPSNGAWPAPLPCEWLLLNVLSRWLRNWSTSLSWLLPSLSSSLLRCNPWI
jgi:hypothetical protein